MRLLLAEDEKTLSNALVTILKHNNYSVDAVYAFEMLTALPYIFCIAFIRHFNGLHNAHLFFDRRD